MPSDVKHQSPTPPTAAPQGAQPRPSDLRNHESTHWSLLIPSIIIIFLACVMSTKGDEQVLVPVINQPLPPLCTTKRFFNLDCPGCGLTRCFISLAHGKVADAWRYNPAGLWFFALVAVQIPYRAWQIYRIRSGRAPLNLGRTNWMLWILLFLMLGQWVVKITMSAV